MRGGYQILVLFIALAAISCEKDDVPYELPNAPKDLNTVQIPMGQRYSKQFFFDLGTNTIVSQNLKTDWDLAFDCSAEGYHIILNSAKFMLAYNTFSTAFDSTFNTTNVKWAWDVASGNLDSTAIGEWGIFAAGSVVSYDHVYLINRGRGITGSKLETKKIVFENLENDTYHFTFSNLNGSDAKSFQITKDPAYNLVYFSFDNGGQQVYIAPEKSEWDLQFTQYTHIFSETPANIPQADTIVPYLVTGILQNRTDVLAAKQITLPFDSIDLATAQNCRFYENKIDVIGYDWKLYNFNANSYSIQDINYIVKDVEGYFYKLRLIDFYSSTGEKGFPKFQYKRL